MTAFIYDGTFEGLLTCVFEAYSLKILPYLITDSSVQTGFGSEILKISSDFVKAERVKKGLKDCATKDALYNIKTAFLSGDPIKSTAIFNFIKYCIDNKKTDESRNFAEPAILNTDDIVRKVICESHRFKGFIRFSESKNGYYYAHYEPDNDITELLIPHFSARFRNMPFIIHDTKRNILAMCAGTEYEIIHPDKPVNVFLSEEETEFQNLWKTYYNSVNIKSRKNLRQMREYMPERYWKNLPEKYQ